MSFPVPEELKLNWKKALFYGIKWVREYFSEAGVKTAVIGMSGGSDSTLTAYITAKAIGANNVLGVMLPEDGITPDEDIRHAESTILALGMRKTNINITTLVKEISGMDFDLEKPENRIAYANVKARLRMVLLYKEANKSGSLVAGTDDRSENILGYFTKYGDGGVDINVPEYLYKTQVRGLLSYIAKKENMPAFDEIAEKPPSPRLWAGHTAENELNMDYAVLDTVLFYLKDKRPKMTEEKLAARLHIEKELINRIMDMARKNAHKNAIPPSPKCINLR